MQLRIRRWSWEEREKRTTDIAARYKENNGRTYITKQRWASIE
jgi:hypothetical protein